MVLKVEFFSLVRVSTVYKNKFKNLIQSSKFKFSFRGLELCSIISELSLTFQAYDDHSGLDSVYWKIYDNYGNYIEHGHEDIVAQGHADR
jgi:hypothetical protein